MRKAYHQVWGIPVRKLLKQEYLRPAINHVSPPSIEGSCKDAMEDLLKEMHTQNRAVSQEAVNTLWQMLEDESVSIDNWQREEGIEPEGGHTNLTCFDLLGGDYDRVFLSGFNWYSPSEGRNGLVFDADFLIDKGAIFRPDDLLHYYREELMDIINDIREKDYDTRFREAIEGVQQRHEKRGKEAKKALDALEEEGKARAKKGLPGLGEIVMEGGIPISWAIEAWENGKKISLKGRH